MHRAALVLILLAFPLSARAGGAGTFLSRTAHDGKLTYFTVQWPNSLWRTDGTSPGTFQLSPDIADVDLGENPVVLNGYVYFLATDDGTRRLWRSDGRHTAEVVFSFDGMHVRGLSAHGSRLFFFSRARTSPDCVRLWTSDGTATGTHVIAALFTDDATSIASTSDAMLFQVYTGPYEYGQRTRYALWRTSGTAEGTYLLADGVPQFVSAAGLLFFERDGGVWRTDGTRAGTFRIGTGGIRWTTPDAVYFHAADREVWRTDGTPRGTTLFRRFNDALPDAFTGSAFVAFWRTSKLSVYGWSGDGRMQLLRTLPLRERAELLHITIGNLVFFLAATPAANELWRTDGTAEGTVLLRAFPITDDPYGFRRLDAVGDRVLLWIDDGVHGREPWVSNGTPEGTRLLKNIAPEGLLRGRVTDAATGRPVTDVAIEVYRTTWYDPNPKLSATIPVDENGEYRYETVESGAIVKARSTGAYVSQTYRSKVDVPGDTVVTADFALTLGARISGRVLSENGKGLRGVTVHLTESIKAVPYASAVTDTSGRYEIAGVPADRTWIAYTSSHPGLSAMANDGVSCAAGCENAPLTPMRLTAGETRNADFVLRPHGRILVRARDAVTGQPVEARVRVHRFGNPSTPLFDAPAGTELALPDGRYSVLVSATGYVLWSRDLVPVPGTTTVLEVELPPAAGN